MPKAATTYVMAAHQSASFDSSYSAGVTILFDLIHANARFDASNSTGKVINEKRVASANNATPIANTVLFPVEYNNIMPAINNNGINPFAIFNMGTMALRNCKKL